MHGLTDFHLRCGTASTMRFTPALRTALEDTGRGSFVSSPCSHRVSNGRGWSSGTYPKS